MIFEWRWWVIWLHMMWNLAKNGSIWFSVADPNFLIFSKKSANRTQMEIHMSSNEMFMFVGCCFAKQSIKMTYRESFLFCLIFGRSWCLSIILWLRKTRTKTNVFVWDLKTLYILFFFISSSEITRHTANILYFGLFSLISAITDFPLGKKRHPPPLPRFEGRNAKIVLF